MEIERKFLVKEIPSLEGLKYSEIKQGYISIKPEVRVRKLDDKYFLTEKGEGTLVREENEREISENEGLALFEKIVSNLIEKKRYYINYEGNLIELDIYEGKFAGLVVAEVEFKTLEDANKFIPPKWFSTDISENMEYRNKILATKY